MTLEEWRKDQGVTLCRLGESLGVTEETARRYCLPERHRMSRFPSRATLHRVYELTDGKVTPNDFLDL